MLSQSGDGSLAYIDQPRPIDTLKENLVKKKRVYKAALKAWQEERAKDSAYASPVTSEDEDN